jgi:hypothetical protein
MIGFLADKDRLRRSTVERLLIYSTGRLTM